MIDVRNSQILTMDYSEFLPLIPDASIDLAIIDPPYSLNMDDWDVFPSHDSFLRFTYRWIDLLIPKLKHTGSLYVFNTPLNSSYILIYLLQRGLLYQNWIVWDKRDGFNHVKRRYINWQETILFITKSTDYTFNSDAIRIPYESTERIKHAQQKGILKNGRRWFPNPNGKLCGDVWTFTSERLKNKVNGKTPKLGHATPKPLNMIERIVLASSNPGDVVLDCFVGSGTTAVAAKLHGRTFIVADQNEAYINMTKSRLSVM